jgi:hypothetical protein
MGWVDVFGSKAAPCVARYWYVFGHAEIVSEFCVANAGDPNQTVESMGPDGQWHHWTRRTRGDLMVFTPPADGSYRPGEPFRWYYDRRLQLGEMADMATMERESLRNRVSVDFGKVIT